MRENRLRLFNWLREELMKTGNKIGEIKIEENQERGRLKKKCMKVIGGYMRSYGVDENMVRDMAE